jgi:hypothetical protein
MAECIICGNEYTKKRKDQVTCGDPKCKKMRVTQTNRAWRKKNPDYQKKYYVNYARL